jgi:hypothetical protein
MTAVDPGPAVLGASLGRHPSQVSLASPQSTRRPKAAGAPRTRVRIPHTGRHPCGLWPAGLRGRGPRRRGEAKWRPELSGAPLL